MRVKLIRVSLLQQVAFVELVGDTIIAGSATASQIISYGSPAIRHTEVRDLLRV